MTPDPARPHPAAARRGRHSAASACRNLAPGVLAGSLLCLGPAGCVAGYPPFGGPQVTTSDGQPLMRSAAGRSLVADDASPLPDVPVPLRFVLMPARSTATPSAGAGLARRVTHVYQGRAGYDQLSTFFADHLARHGWRRDPAGPASGPIRAYLKGPEQLHLSLSEAGGVATVSILITAPTRE